MINLVIHNEIPSKCDNLLIFLRISYFCLLPQLLSNSFHGYLSFFVMSSFNFCWIIPENYLVRFFASCIYSAIIKEKDIRIVISINVNLNSFPIFYYLWSTFPMFANLHYMVCILGTYTNTKNCLCNIAKVRLLLCWKLKSIVK